MGVRRGMLAYVVAAAVLAWSGCGGGAPRGDDAKARGQLRMVGIEYGRYLVNHGNAPPADVDAFRAFVDQQIAKTPDYGVKSAEELLTSPRDGLPVTVIVGGKAALPDQPDVAWAAYEQTGVDGKRLVTNVRGVVEEMTDQELQDRVLTK